MLTMQFFITIGSEIEIVFLETINEMDLRGVSKRGA
jgi:hypothetical protein